MAEGRVRGHDYSDPYLAGAALGLVLLASFFFAGRGLGASGAFTSVAASLVSRIDAAVAQRSPIFIRQLGNDWLLLELAGVVIGAFVSAFFAGRLRMEIERGPNSTQRARLVASLAGGALMGIGAALARGCTSGLALTGGALLSAGAWLFVICAFAAAYGVAPILRKAWR